MDELAVCPFCGRGIEIYGSNRGIFWIHKNGDSGCIMLTPSLIRGAKSLQEGRERWNRRVINAG